MPAADVHATLPRVSGLNQVVEAKKRWGVSAMALIVRLSKLDIISEWQYRTLAIQATERGYRKTEPFPLPREKSVVWQKVLTALWSDRITKDEIARDLCVPTSEIENMIFGLTVTDQETGGAVRPPLRLVSS